MAIEIWNKKIADTAFFVTGLEGISLTWYTVVWVEE